MTATAADQIAALEAEGTPTAEQLAAARVATAAELAAAIAAIFEPAATRPRSADDIATLEWIKGRFTHSAFVPQLAAAHRTALADSPGVAALCRTSEVCEDVHAAAGLVAHPHAATTAGAAAVRRYQVAICEQLAEGSDAPSAARSFLAAVDLEARIAAIETRAAERVAAAAQAAEEERKAAARAALDRALTEETAAAGHAATATAAATAAERAHVQARAAVLAERLRLCGRDVLRTAHEVFDVAPLIDAAPHLCAMDVDRFLRALDRAEESAR